MITIDHQQAAVDSIRMWLLGLGSLTLDEVNDLAPKFVTAATPHLRAEWLADRLGDIARAVQGSTCNILYESGDWEAGTVGFYWCETHRPDAEPKFEGDQSAWEYDNGVCPDVLKAAHAVLALLEGGGE